MKESRTLGQGHKVLMRTTPPNLSSLNSLVLCMEPADTPPPTISNRAEAVLIFSSAWRAHPPPAYVGGGTEGCCAFTPTPLPAPLLLLATRLPDGGSRQTEM